MISCKSDGLITNKTNKYEKYEDSYKNNVYTNHDIGLNIQFNKEWVIVQKYVYFDDFQKKFARFFYSDKSEVLFIGYDDNQKTGLRCTVENIDITNEQYLEKLKKLLKNDIETYNIAFIKEEEVVLKNIKGIHLIYESFLNSNNHFVFDSLIFKYQDYHFKMDFWLDNEEHPKQKEKIMDIYQSIKFINIHSENETPASLPNP
jgi:hypothetical protein